jgi:hypothetical protein
MATVIQIITAGNECASTVVDRMLAMSKLDPSGTNAAVQAKLNNLQNKHAGIAAATAAAVAASGDLEAAVTALESAARKLKDTAAIMTDLTKFLNKADEFASYAQGAVDTLKSVTGRA